MRDTPAYTFLSMAEKPAPVPSGTKWKGLDVRPYSIRSVKPYLVSAAEIDSYLLCIQTMFWLYGEEETVFNVESSTACDAALVSICGGACC